MKKFKNLHVTEEFYVDGKQVNGDNKPTTGKYVISKITYRYLSEDAKIYISDIVTGKAVLADSDTFDFAKGKDIAHIRAMKQVLASIKQAIIDKMDEYDRRVEIMYRDFEKCDKLRDYYNFNMEALTSDEKIITL